MPFHHVRVLTSLLGARHHDGCKDERDQFRAVQHVTSSDLASLVLLRRIQMLMSAALFQCPSRELHPGTGNADGCEFGTGGSDGLSAEINPRARSMSTTRCTECRGQEFGGPVGSMSGRKPRHVRFRFGNWSHRRDFGHFRDILWALHFSSRTIICIRLNHVALRTIFFDTFVCSTSGREARPSKILWYRLRPDIYT